MNRIPLAYHLRAMAGAPLRRSMRKARNAFLSAAELSCRETQFAVLQNLLHLNADSRFSIQHGLKPGLSLAEFRACIPVTDYEYHRPWVEHVAGGDHAALLGSGNRLLMFAVTSGTTAASKLIPVTQRFLDDYRRGWQVWGIGAYSRHAALQKLNIVQISSSHRKFASAGGTPCGNISGLVASMQNPIVRTLYTIPAVVAEIDNPDAKRYVILRLALADRYPGMLITANPSTLIQLAELARERAEMLIRDIFDGTLQGCEIPSKVRSELERSLRSDRPRAKELGPVLSDPQAEFARVWPRLGLLGVWCGGSAGAYLPRLRSLFGAIPIRDHGLHASEGRMTLPLADESPAGVLDIGTHFFEFIPVSDEESSNPRTLTAEELVAGQDYFILLTTSSGLWRYNIRDVVRCTGFHGATPLLEFLHKGAHISSITGEKLAESQVVSAVHAVAEQTGLRPLSFTLTTQWGQPPCYVLFARWPETEGRDSGALNRFRERLDAELCRQNSEYSEKRGTGRLGMVLNQNISDEAWKRFAEWRLASTGSSLEQYKHPCLLPDPKFESLFLKACSGGQGNL